GAGRSPGPDPFPRRCRTGRRLPAGLRSDAGGSAPGLRARGFPAPGGERRAVGPARRFPGRQPAEVAGLRRASRDVLILSAGFRGGYTPMKVSSCTAAPRRAGRGVGRGSGVVDLATASKLRSAAVTEGHRRAPHRAMFRATGLDDEDLARPLIGIANTWTEAQPCNFHLRDLAEHVKRGVRDAGGTPLEFNSVAVNDAIGMGHEGMKASLVSRELIADSIE